MNALLERRKRDEEPEVVATPEDLALLQEIRDILRSQATRWRARNPASPLLGSYRDRRYAMRFWSSSAVAIAVGGPPHAERTSWWIIPCGWPVR